MTIEEGMGYLFHSVRVPNQLRKIKLKDGTLIEQNPNKDSEFARIAKEHENMILLAWLIPEDGSSWQLYIRWNISGNVLLVEGTNDKKLQFLKSTLRR